MKMIKGGNESSQYVLYICEIVKKKSTRVNRNAIIVIEV